MLIEDKTVATHLYRIAQEAVTNSVKHGKAKQIRIEFFLSSERIILAVSDDGVGFIGKPQPLKSLGLRIMKHRASMIGGGSFAVQISNGQPSQIVAGHHESLPPNSHNEFPYAS